MSLTVFRDARLRKFMEAVDNPDQTLQGTRSGAARMAPLYSLVDSYAAARNLCASWFPRIALRNCLKKGRPLVTRYPTTYEKGLFNRCLRCRVVLPKNLPAPSKTRGRPRLHRTREVLNAIFYGVRGGCPWRLLPHDFPP